MHKCVKYILFFIVVTIAMCPATAQETVDSAAVMRRVGRNALEIEQLLSLPWSNPAVMQFKRDYSLSEVRVGYTSRNENQAVDVQQGDKDYTLAFDACTYMKHRNSTLWSEAYYNNGRIKGINWNETSEPQVVQPYVLADSVGGNMNVERYSFMGGWANYNGRWAVGASLGYTAGLYYRNVDPRPRNVTACLDAQVGIGYNVWNGYVIAASLNYRKYKQTNNVAFYSELGSDKIFHLVGFANDYSRFAGTGIQTYYNGNRLGATLNFQPSGGSGFSASVNASRFSFNNIITQLNKLPMAHVTHNQLQAEVGWIGANWGVRAHVGASRRVGTENIFGDPAGSVYAQIGALDMYHQNRFEAGIAGVWEKNWWTTSSTTCMGLAVCPKIEYSHLNEIYSDPASLRQINEMNYSLKLKFTTLLSWRTHLALVLGVNHAEPTKTSLDFDSGEVKPELAGLERVVRSTFEYMSSGRTSFNTSASVTVAINKKYALRGKAGWQRTAYVMSTHRNELDFSLSFLF